MPSEPTAAQRVRDSIAALTEGERYAGPWEATQDGGDHWWICAGGLSIANCGLGGTAQRAAEHAALLASPHVGEALANLLEARRAETLALATWVARQIPEDHARLVDAQHALTRAFAALEAAINREQA